MRPGRRGTRVPLRDPSAWDRQLAPRGSGEALGALIRALAPGDEEALRRGARVIALWPAVCSVSIEVTPERVGRPSILASGGGGDSAQHEPAHLRIDLLDRECAIGVLSVWFEESDGAPPEVPAWCETAAVLVGGVAARCRLEAMLLDAQCCEPTGQIAAGLVHDFNNILTGIMGNASIASALVDPEDRAALPIQRIEEATRSAASLARALLQFVRGGTERGAVSLNELAAATRQVMSRAIRDDVSIGLDLAPDAPTIEGEPALIQQALVNLILNAAAINGEGGVTIRTRRLQAVPASAIGRARPSAAYAALSVIDTGSGIAPEHLPEVFRPFFTTKGSAGAGLGLASVVQIARRHGGAVGVESRPGMGSTFTIYLPVAPRPDVPETEPPATALPRVHTRRA